MFDKYKKPESFYKAYDSISMVFPFHTYLFSFLKKNFKNVSSKETAHLEIIKLFVEYFYTTFFEDNPLTERLMKQHKPIYHEIFSCCYEKKFGVKPGLKHEIMKRLSDPTSKNIFENVKKIKSGNKDVKQEEFDLIKDQFVFVHEFSKFIYANKDKEPPVFFRRFLNDFDFEAEGYSSIQNTDWVKEHKTRFEIIKQDNQADEKDFKETRKWYKEQLYKVDFNALDEKDKAIFVLEMFVAFGNVSDPDTGGPTGFIRPLKDSIFLGRYYNVHQLPLQYVNWTEKLHPENKKQLKNLAYETKRKLCGLRPIPPQKIKEAHDAGLDNMALDPGGQKARRIDLSRIDTQEPIIGALTANDGIKESFDKLINNFSIFDVSQAKNKQSALNCVLDVFERAKLPISIKDGDKEDVLNVVKKLKGSKFLQDLTVGYVSKIGMSKFSLGLVTHYEKSLTDGFYSNPENLNLEDLVNHFLKK